MVLVDTSVWIAHFRYGNARLKALLTDCKALCHPFIIIIGEIACGNPRNRSEIVSLLQALPLARIAEDNEVLRFIDQHRLMGLGVGWVDMHLMASALLSRAMLWTEDKKLRTVADLLGVLYEPRNKLSTY